MLQYLLLERMVRSSTPIVLGLYGIYPWLDPVRRSAAGLAGKQFCVAEFDQLFSFPYQAPEGHNSLAGNVFLAHQYLAMLLGQPVEAPVLSTAEAGAASEQARAPAADLTAYEEAYVQLNGIEGGFVPAT